MKTKIYLTIGGQLALTGVFYASNPTVFVLPGNGVNRPISPAVTQALFTVTQYEDGIVDVVGCNRQGSQFGILPIGQQLVEKYMVIAPAESAAAGFTPGDLFVTVQQSVVKTTPPMGVFMPFASWSGVAGGCPNSDHSSLTFDKVGTFGFKMIITCEGGRIFTIDNLPGGPHVAHLTDTTTPAHGQTFIEGPDVLPLSFGPLGGQIMVADDQVHQLYTIKNDGTVNYNPFGFPDGTFYGAEQVLTIPAFPCTFNCGDFAFFTVSAVNNTITAYPRSDFDGLGGDILVTSELNPNFGTFRVHFDVPSNSYQFSIFDAASINNEGSAFVDGACSPTPTPTPTFTPTPTPTPTATFTPTPTPTPTMTPTTCGSSFVIGDLDAVVGNKVTFWGAQWWKKNHLSGGSAPASFKGFANCTNPNPPTCGGTWQSDPGNSSHPPDTVPADMTVIVSSLITKSGQIESGDIPMMVTIHTDPGYDGNPGHEGTGTVTAVVCQSAQPGAPQSGGPRTHHHASPRSKSILKRLLHPFRR